MNKRLGSIILVVILIAIVFALIIVERIKYQNEMKLRNNLYIVNNYSVFFTLDDCANRYIEYISSGDVKDLELLLNKDYVKENNINSGNMLDIVDDIGFRDNYASIKTKKVLAKKVSDNVTKYYLYGEIYLEGIDDDVKYGDYYLEINIDSDTLIFDVRPYDGKVFKEAK